MSPDSDSVRFNSTPLTRGRFVWIVIMLTVFSCTTVVMTRSVFAETSATTTEPQLNVATSSPATLQSQGSTTTPESEPVDTSQATTSSTETPQSKKKQTNAGIRDKVAKAFHDAPTMVYVAECESRFRQFTDSGNVLYGGYQNAMVGIFQVYERVHGGDAKRLGYNLETVDGNISYARHLYNRSGTDPWISSFGCWGSKARGEERTRPETVLGTLTANLHFGNENPQVQTLQTLLNKAGYIVAADGGGSPGNETMSFGSLTRSAVRRFQCDKLAICSGDEHSTGYGFVRASTRGLLNTYSDAPYATRKDTSRLQSASTSTKSSTSKRTVSAKKKNVRIELSKSKAKQENARIELEKKRRELKNIEAQLEALQKNSTTTND
jgi:hypothetical protein